ncbi:hypothetical protein [Fodinibius sediminis]|uniref:Uncharacterized protein n=1 Tax=Fodinibius sediminis TaxID=1214077 RepID=A0A521FA22_9BACT|nr:hypothetical protein [Fodinibius sediminis]SMO92481.1 hypothetical protein SAMN06265218_1265 [Fodinibius sediminis]
MSNQESKSTNIGAYVIMGMGALLTFISAVKSGMGASSVETTMYTVGGLVIVGIGGIIHTIGNKS